MTVCGAAICDNGKALVLVADKRIGIGFIESERDINKLIELHKGWCRSRCERAALLPVWRAAVPSAGTR